MESVGRVVWNALHALGTHPSGSERESTVLVALDAHEDLLIESALANRMGPALAESLRCSGRSIPQSLSESAQHARFARSSSLMLLDQIGPALDSSDVPWVVIKGPVVAEMYPDPTLRPFVDLDLLVSGRQLGVTIDALTGIGIEDVNSNWGNYIDFGVAETPLLAPGLGIDLHWRLVALGTSRAEIAFDIDAILDRRVTYSIGSRLFPTLEPTDTLMHLCVHAGLSGAARLGALLDIGHAVRYQTPDWDALISRARVSGGHALIGQVLDRVRELVAAPIPIEVSEALCAKPMLLLRRTLDRRARGQRLPQSFVPSTVVLATGADAAATCRSTGRVMKDRLGPTKVSWNVGDPEGPLYWDRISGDYRARDDYLAMAARDAN